MAVNVWFDDVKVWLRASRLIKAGFSGGFMSIWWRRVAAAILGLLVFFLLSAWGLFVGWMNAGFVLPMDTVGGLLEQGYNRADIYYLKDNDALATIGFITLAFAGGLVATILTLATKMKLRSRLAVVLVVLLLLVPLSAANFHSQDLFSSRSVQAAINIPMILLGIFSLFYLYDLDLRTREAQILRVLASALIVMQAVCLPAIYTILWWLNFQNAISLSATRNFSPGWISSLSAILGLAFGIYKFLRETSDSEKPKKARIWLPGEK